MEQDELIEQLRGGQFISSNPFKQPLMKTENFSQQCHKGHSLVSRNNQTEQKCRVCSQLLAEILDFSYWCCEPCDYYLCDACRVALI